MGHLASAPGGLRWTLLRASIYAEYTVDALETAIATGRLVHKYGDGRTPHMSREELAAVASVVLTTDRHRGATYGVTGPELLPVPTSPRSRPRWAVRPSRRSRG